jgi:hypothetical protein
VILKMNSEEAKKFVDGIYRQVAERWRERVSSAQFMKALASGNLPKKTFRLFFKNWAAYTIEINTLEAASYHKHIHFFRKHRDLMAAMAEKLADELIHPKPPGHIHVVIETAKALGISEDEIFVSPHAGRVPCQDRLLSRHCLGRNGGGVLRRWCHRGAVRPLGGRSFQRFDHPLRAYPRAGGVFFTS